MIYLKFYLSTESLKFFLLSLVSFLIFLSTGSVSALDWNDNAWIEGKCPSNIFGRWVSVDGSANSEKLLIISRNKIIILNNQALGDEFSFKEKNMIVGKRFVDILIKPASTNKKKIAYLKIRPHQVSAKQNSSKTNTHSCLIKVFEFDSKNNAKFDKYLNWGIYKLDKR